MFRKGLSLILVVLTVLSVFVMPISVNAATKTFDEIVRTAGTVIRTSEGVYSSVNLDDNGAVSIGILQWHATRALNLLKTVVNANKTNALKILGKTLYDEILSAKSWETRILTKAEGQVVSTLLDTAEGHAAEDKLIYDDVASYINHGHSLTLTNPLTLVYYADLENQCGFGGASRIANAAIAKAGNKEITIDMLHKAALEDSVAGRYATRRNKAYNLCMLLGWDDAVGYDCEVWTATTYLNIRPEAGIYNTPVGGVSAGQSVVITEKVFFDDDTWGKSYMGWICLDYCDYIRGDIPCHVFFHEGEGKLPSDTKATAKATALNTTRTSNNLIIYDEDYGSATQTNAYGYEAAVDANGKVISKPTYGTCKTKIPAGGLVLSAHGTQGTWLNSKVSVGNYVWVNKDTLEVFVYASQEEYLATRKYVYYGMRFGTMPTPTRAGYLFNGWVDKNGKSYISQSLYPTHLCMELFPTWKSSECAISYDLQGGAFLGTSAHTVNGINRVRGANELIVYDTGTTTGTNPYGREAAVSAEGIVTEVYPWGTCNNEIPEGGFILSGHEEGSKFIGDNISVGNYVVFDKDSMTVNVYSSKDYYYALNKQLGVGEKVGVLPEVTKFGYEFVEWQDVSGRTVTPDTKVPVGGLVIHAVWKLLPGKLIFDTAGGTIGGALSDNTVYGTNITRPSDKIIIYKDRATSGTNVYGYEAAVDKNGVVVASYPYGQGNAAVPSGGFVVSAMSAAGSWVNTNLKVGRAVTLSDGKITVYSSDGNRRAALGTTVTYGSTYGELPTPTKEGFVFEGWYDKNGNEVTPTTKVKDLGDVTIHAKWLPAVSVTFDAAGGTIKSANVTCTADGVNVQRTANTLVIYEGKETTGTNAYGFEITVDRTGLVTKVGGGNSAVPKYGYVISAHGTKVSLISSVKVGNYVDVKGKYINVYESVAAYEATLGKVTVSSGDSLGVLPAATKADAAFVGWMGKDGELTKNTVITEDCTFVAKWTISKAPLVLMTDGGTFDEGAVYGLSGVNVQRTTDTVVLYKGKDTTGTNAYGAEVIIKYNGYGGEVVGIIPSGQGNAKIPAGCAVLSGHGKGATWLLTNLSLGSYVDISGNVLRAYETKADSTPKTKTLKAGDVYGELPTPKKDGYTFIGWKDGAGNTVSSSTVVRDLSYGATLTAQYAKTALVTFAGADVAAPISITSSGINLQRAANMLVIYEGVATTGTNAYGAEALVDKNGIVTAVYKSGKGNNAVPEGGFIISAHGTRYSEVSSIAIGSYVQLNGKSVKVYPSKDAYDMQVGRKYAVGTTLSSLPTPIKAGCDFVTWKYADSPVTAKTVVSGDMLLIAEFTAKQYTVTLDFNGGSLGIETVTADGINTQRYANQLIIQTIPEGADEYTFTNNEFGRVAVFDREGTLISSNYGTTQTTLTNGQFALSGNGDKSQWLKDNLPDGSYAAIDNLTVTVSPSKENINFRDGTVKVLHGNTVGALPVPTKANNDFDGWSVGGALVDSSYVVYSNVTLTALYSPKKATVVFNPEGGTIDTTSRACTITGYNVQRTANTLVVFTNGGTTTHTNNYGMEMVVGADGVVSAIYGYGKGNNTVPVGGFIVSAHGSACDFFKNTVHTGSYIELSGNTLTLWDSKGNARLTGLAIRVPIGDKAGDLPTPVMADHAFLGWSDGEKDITPDTVVGGNMMLSAKWEHVPVTVTFDFAGGTLSSKATTANGTNCTRLANQLIIQTIPQGGGTRTFTNNAYGTVAICDADGRVISVTYGLTSVTLANGEFALSGNGTMSSWLSANVRQGNYVKISGLSVCVYKSITDMQCSGGKLSVPYGTALSDLPAPVLAGYELSGFTLGGAPFDTASPVYTNITLTAQYK